MVTGFVPEVKSRAIAADFHLVGVCSGVLKGKRAFALAKISGGRNYPDIAGVSEFFLTPLGVLITAEIRNLPRDGGNHFAALPFGIRLAGDGNCLLPPVFGNGGFAWCAYLAAALKPADIIGGSLIISEGKDAREIARGTIKER